jgi:hypothetical protein
MTTIKLNQYVATDEQLQEGEWVTLDCVPDFECLVAKANNSLFGKRLDKLREKYTRRNRPVPPAKDRRFLRDAASEYI